MIALILGVCLAPAYGQTVKVTPLGARTGEFCALDRALLFEDPTGVRILYDPGSTIRGGTDPRLGDVHAILISHGHNDHVGLNMMTQDPDAQSAACTAAAAATSAAPYTNLVRIAVAKNAAIVGDPTLVGFLSNRAAELTGSPTAFCAPPFALNDISVPRAAPCNAILGIGAKLTIRYQSGAQGVQIAAVPAAHTNGVSNSLLDEPEKTNLALIGGGAGGVYAGIAEGFVVTFTNGLVAYLSGDTGVINDMASIVNGLYGAKLAVLPIGDQFTMGPEEAADAVNRLIQPKAVIPSHAGEVATTNGVVNENTRTARFINLLRGPAAYVARSGRVIEFDGSGNCTAGCLEIPVTGVTFSPSTVRLDGSFTATFTGTSLGSQTYFDIRFRAPGGTIDQLAFNWQQGITATHTLPPGTPAGQYTVTGVRAHQSPGDHSGVFSAVSATLVVTSVP